MSIPFNYLRLLAEANPRRISTWRPVMEKKKKTKLVEIETIIHLGEDLLAQIDFVNYSLLFVREEKKLPRLNGRNVVIIKSKEA